MGRGEMRRWGELIVHELIVHELIDHLHTLVTN